MEYRIEKKDAFQVIAVKERVLGGGEIGKQEIKNLWMRSRENGLIEKLCQFADPNGVFGDALAGIALDNPHVGDFDYALGACYTGGEVPEGLTVETIPAYTWLIFPCRGQMPDAFVTLCKRIYTEFLPTSEYQPAGGLCLEIYPGDNVEDKDYYCELWLSAEKK